MGLSKTQMRGAIENGGSVLYQGKLITNLAQLAKVSGTEAEKSSEIADLKKRLAELEGGQSAPAESSAKQESANGESSEEALDDTAEELKKHTRQELIMKAQADGIEVGEADTKAEIIGKILAQKK